MDFLDFLRDSHKKKLLKNITKCMIHGLTVFIDHILLIGLIDHILFDLRKK
jgi:hypothetical protein